MQKIMILSMNDVGPSQPPALVALILPAGPESTPPTAARFRDPAEESPLIPWDPRGYFQLSGCLLSAKTCVSKQQRRAGGCPAGGWDHACPQSLFP